MKKSYRLVAFLTLPVFFGCGGSEQTAASDAAPTAAQQVAAEPISAPEIDRASQRAAEVRQSVLKLISNNFGPMRNMARKEAPFDAPVVRKNSLRLHQLSLMMADAFATDTRGSDVVTEALDVIWETPEAFAGKIEALTTAAGALAESAASADEASILAAVGELGQKCGSCHDDFRQDD
ncbi:MAG: cytochrome c [Gammaproteobacteria bacterium]|nr:cytochrome c [Gammaproteobacteria bacterium]MDH3373383.1 cytochrome c [Gammaproteobacteria bacterium]MDH3552130.1 cytochrome c [Gammaproteobacteria bacterium]